MRYFPTGIKTIKDRIFKRIGPLLPQMAAYIRLG
jgi:hypothetical protein